MNNTDRPLGGKTEYRGKAEARRERIRSWNNLRDRLYRMVSVGVVDVPVNQAYDILSITMLIANLTVAFMSTFEQLDLKFGAVFDAVEAVTVLFFAVDYALRVLTARSAYPNSTVMQAVGKYMTSFAGIVDLLSFLPYYLPIVFPAGAVAFRMIRVARIMRLFRINANVDSMNVITEVLKAKRQQLQSSVFIIVVMMMASSLCMYSVEHEAQPDVFKNAFSGIWWSVSTLLTVGYGDIYPITFLGKLLGTFIAFMGVGLVAIPTGIISAGFVEQYANYTKISDQGTEKDLQFIRVRLTAGDPWSGKSIREIGLPKGSIMAAVQRGNDTLVPRGDVVLKKGDLLIIGAESTGDGQPVRLREVTLENGNKWTGEAIRDLDISRQTYIVMVRRNGRTIVPSGGLRLSAGDTVYMYSKEKKRT